MRNTSEEIPQKCPKCNSNRVVNIVYGYPAPETFREAENGKIALGGCYVTGDDTSSTIHPISLIKTNITIQQD